MAADHDAADDEEDPDAPPAEVPYSTGMYNHWGCTPPDPHQLTLLRYGMGGVELLGWWDGVDFRPFGELVMIRRRGQEPFPRLLPQDRRPIRWEVGGDKQRWWWGPLPIPGEALKDVGRAPDPNWGPWPE